MSGNDPRHSGRVVTFYSYKGGTGRTMALANVAWLLAANGYRVLTIDWDLESPGLHRYFHPFLQDKQIRQSDGILDLVRQYSDATMQSGARPERFAELAQIEDYAVSLTWDFPSGGVVDFVPAGRQDSAYVTKVSTFDWDSFWRKRRGGWLIDALAENMRKAYDFVLIDSRTGSSDTAGICTIRLPDIVVNCFTLNTQSTVGAVAMTQSIMSQCDAVVFPLPTRIDAGEKQKLDRGRSFARRSFEPYLTFLEGEDSATYWDSMEVPYIPYYAYEEVLAVFGDTSSAGGSLLARYLRLAGRIAGHDCKPLSIGDAERMAVVRAFEQSTPPEPMTVLVAYAPLDRIWAEWLRDRLGGAGQRVRLYCVRNPVPSLEGVNRLITIVSRDLVRYAEAGRLSRLAAERVASGDSHFHVTLRVDATPLEPAPAARSLVDAMGVPEDRTLEMLAPALGGGGSRLRHPDDLYAEPAEIRYPSVGVEYWNLQLGRNARFSGRGALLEEIRDRLQASGTSGSQLALTGLPGVGKTQLAIEYVYRFAAAYDVVWWISATQPGRGRIALADLAQRLKLKPGTDVETQVAAVLEALRVGSPTRRWLVVFDNADAPSDFEDLLPTGAGHTLITSRNPQWSARMPMLDIDVFQREESVELLRRRVSQIAEGDARRLAARVGDLPLAVEQAGGWLATTGMAVEDYLRLLEGSAARAMEESAPDEYRETITSTVYVAYDELRQRNPAAARLAELYACMAPEAIPYRLVSNKRLTELLTPIDPRMHDPMLHATLNREIGRYALARVDTGAPRTGVVMHRLTQEIIRSRLTEEEQAERRADVHTVLAAVERGSPDNGDNWKVYEALRPHLQPSGVLESEAPEVRLLVIDTVRYLWKRADVASAEELARAALREWSPRTGQDDTSTLRLNYELAVALRYGGNEDEAYELNKESLARLRATLGEEHPYALRAASSFGADLRARGQFHDARELDERTAEAMRSVLGDDDPLTLDAVSNLATSLRLVGEFSEAARLDRETLERRRKVLGHRHPATLSSQDNLGTDLRELGDLARARNNDESAANGCTETLGQEHPQTLRAAKSFAVTLRRLGDLTTSGDLISQTYARTEGLFGGRHRDTIACRLELTCVQWALGQHEDARKAGEEIYGVCRELWGQHHPLTLAAGNNLSIFRRWAGDVDSARRLAERTTERLQASLGPRHPHTLTGLLTLANALYADGARAEARQRDEAAYSRLRKALPEEHPTVLAAAVNYAISHRSEDVDRAEASHADATQRLRNTLGAEHPYARSAGDWMRIDVDIEPLPI
ncbi:FxSxx-COOH system tetratricopeptide repeat protein [Phytohabitans sp. LJ34]|uniref:FxSxx-COOH system tetratricopeptide repeat protein n=1 Tax=Phytohabitans sp. LJ34 TaxID=3452217 RepID=UPI003F8C4C6C